MKNNPFEDLSFGDMGKYKERNDEAIRRERATQLDERVMDLNKSARSLTWANKVFEFYNEEEKLNSDIFDISTKLPILNQMKKEAQFLKDKNEQEKAERKKEEERQIEENALRIDDFISDLEKAEKSVYWCKDVKQIDKEVEELDPKVRSKCKKLSILENLKEEIKQIEAASKLDEKIKDLEDVKERDEVWCDSVISFGKKITKKILPYVKEKSTYDALLLKAKTTLDAINKEKERLKKEEEDRLAKEKAEREKRETEERLAREKERLAEIEAREKIEIENKRREEERKRYLAEQRLKEEKAARRRKKAKIVLLVLISVIVSAVLLSIAFSNSALKTGLICFVILALYFTVWNSIRFIGEKDIKIPFMIINSVLSLGVIGLLFLPADLMSYALILSFGFLAIAIIDIFMAKKNYDYFKDERVFYQVPITVSAFAFYFIAIINFIASDEIRLAVFFAIMGFAAITVFAFLYTHEKREGFYVVGSVIALALIIISIFSAPARPYLIALLLISAYGIVWNIIRFSDKVTITVPYLIVNSVLSGLSVATSIVFTESRAFWAVITFGMFVTSILHLPLADKNYDYKSKYFQSYGVPIETSGFAFVICNCLCFISGRKMYVFIGLGLIAVSLLYGILSKASGDMEYDYDDGYTIYNSIKLILISVAGIAFLFISQGFATLAIFMFLLAALTVGFTFYDDCDYYHMHLLWYIIPTIVSIIIMNVRY